MNTTAKIIPFLLATLLLPSCQSMNVSEGEIATGPDAQPVGGERSFEQVLQDKMSELDAESYEVPGRGPRRRYTLSLVRSKLGELRVTHDAGQALDEVNVRELMGVRDDALNRVREGLMSGHVEPDDLEIVGLLTQAELGKRR